MSLRALPGVTTKTTLDLIAPLVCNNNDAIFSTKASKYYTVDELNKNTNIFKILSCNVRSLQSHFTEIKDLILESNCSVFCMQEIWAVPNVMLFEIPGYDLIINPRVKAPGGGTGFYIKHGIDYNININIMAEKILEATSITLTTPFKKPLTINNIYLGHKNKRTSLIKLNKLLNDTKNKKHDTLLVGDFNIDLIKTTAITTEFQNILIDHELLANIKMPTRIERRNNCINFSLIDNIFSPLNFKGYYYTVVSQIADHLTVGVDLNINTKITKPAKEKITYRKYNTESMAKVSADLNNINWNNMLSLNLEEMVDFLTNKINESLNKHIPLITITKTKKMDNVWFTKGLQKSKLKLRKLEKRFKLKPNLLNKTTLDEYSKLYKNLNKENKK